MQCAKNAHSATANAILPRTPHIGMAPTTVKYLVNHVGIQGGYGATGLPIDLAVKSRPIATPAKAEASH